MLEVEFGSVSSSSGLGETGDGGIPICCRSEGRASESFFVRSAKRKAGSLDELWFWRCVCRLLGLFLWCCRFEVEGEEGV